MEVVRAALVAGCFGAAAYGFFAFTATPELLSVSDASLHRMGDALIFVAKIDNPGGADRLTGIETDAAARSLLTGRDLAIPAGATPSLAMDGVHGVLMGVQGRTEEGRLIPVSLWFENAGRLTTRARVARMEMDHTQHYEVAEGEPQPSLTLSAEPANDGWRVTLSTENFSFSQDTVDGPHRPGTGHGHLYLNGLKLQRVFGVITHIGALPPGNYTFRATLNTNDHRIYSISGKPVSATWAVTIK